MSRRLVIVFMAAQLGLLLSGCGSSGGQQAEVVERGASPAVVGARGTDVAMIDRGGDPEAYRGPLVAALVTGGGSGGEVGRRMAGTLAGTDIFATVLPVASVGDAHEAEIIIMPTVLDAQPGGGGLERVSLRVKTWRKGTGEVGIDQVYQGRRTGRGDAVANAMEALNQDLARRYGARAVF